MKKGIKSSFLIALIIFGFINTILPSSKVFAQSPGEISHNVIVVFEGKEITSSFKTSAPFRLNGSVYMPAKVLNAALGLDVNYHKESNSIYIGAYNIKTEVKSNPDSNKVNLIINDQVVTPTDSLGKTIHPVQLNSTVYVPVTLMKQEFDKEVIYDSAINTVFIEDKKDMGRVKARTLSTPQYDYINSIDEGLIKVKKNNKHGFLDLSGNNVVPIEYKEIGPPTEGLIAVQKDKLFGYIDYKGKLAIPYLFESASPFDGDMAFVQKNNKTIHINKQGKTIFNPNTKYERYEKIDDDTFFIRIGGKERIVNRQGKILKTLPYDHISFYVDEWEMARVSSKGKFGYINKYGDELVPPIYDQSPQNFFRLGGKKGFIDIETKKVVKPIYDHISTFSDGLAAVAINDKFGFINQIGDTVIPLKFDDATAFSDSLAAVASNDKFGYINNKGETIIPLKFDHAEVFSEGIGAVSVDKKYGYVNNKGDLVVPTNYDQVANAENGYGVIKKDNMEGLVNTKGDIIIPLQSQYELTKVHSDDMIVVYDKEKRKYGAINIKGDIVVEADCPNFLYELAEGVYQIDRLPTESESSSGHNQFGLVDGKGNVIIPREYDTIYHLMNHGKTPVYEEIFMVEKDGVQGLIAVRDFKKGI